MFKRVMSALVLLVIVAVCFVASKASAMLLVAAFGLLSCHEMSNAFKKLGRNVIEFLPMIFIVASTLMIYFKLDMLCLVACVGLIFLVDFVVCMKSKKHTSQDALATLSTLAYPVLPFVGVIYVCSLPAPDWIVIFLTGFLSAIGCDTFAFFGGMLFGKHKLAPAVSPNKTIEGSITGTVVTTAICAGLWFLFKDYIGYELWAVVVTVAVCTIVGQVGDLCASFIKREAGIKDFGNLIPGHGGALDRIDSLMFSVPTAYILLSLFERA